MDRESRAASLPTAFSAARSTLAAPLLIVHRDFAGLARGRFVWGVRIAAATLATGLALAATWNMDRYAHVSSEHVGEVLFRMTAAVQVLVAMAMAPLWAAGRVSADRVSGLEDVLALTPLSRVGPTFGRILGAWLLTVVVCLSVAPVQLVAVGFGGVARDDLLHAAVALGVLAFAGAAAGALTGGLPLPPLPCLALLVTGLALFHEGLPALDRWMGGGMLLSRLHPWSTLAWALGRRHPGASRDLLATGMVAALVALWLQERRRGVASVRPALSRASRRRIAVALLILAYEVVPALLLFAWEDLAAGEAVASMLLAFDVLVVLLAPTAVAATVLGRERERGTLPLLVLTGAGPRSILSRAWRPALLVALGAAGALAVHQWFFDVTSALPIVSATLPIDAFVAGLVLAALGMPAALCGRTPLTSVSLAVGSALAASLFAPAFLALAPGRLDREALALSPLCSLLVPDVVPSPVFVPLVPILAMMGFVLLEPVHRRLS